MIKPIKETGHNLRKMNVNAPSFNTITYGKNSFKYRGSVLWNDLPKSVNACKLQKTIMFLRSYSVAGMGRNADVPCVDVRTKHAGLQEPHLHFFTIAILVVCRGGGPPPNAPC